MRKVVMAAVAAVVGLALVVLLVAAVQQAREAARRMQCTNNLKQIVLGLHNYHDVFGKLPPTAMGENSWRIRLDPFLESSPFFDMYRIEEPWDSEWNRTIEFRQLKSDKETGEPFTKLTPTEDMIGDIDPSSNSRASYLWQCPTHQERKSPYTSYLMLVGPTAVGMLEDGRSIKEIADDLSHTIIVAEYAGHGISWLEPKDFDTETMSFRINDPGKPSISSHHPGGALVGMADGSVRWLSNDLPPEVVKAMITINGGEKIIEDENAPGGFRLEQ